MKIGLLKEIVTALARAASSVSEGRCSASVVVMLPNGNKDSAQIYYWKSRTKWHVQICVAGETIRRKAWDVFDAFAKARGPFEKKGIRFLCYGASLGAWPSGMLREAGGLKVYKLGEVDDRARAGRPPSARHLWDIFEGGADVIPCTAREQATHAAEWHNRKAIKECRPGEKPYLVKVD